MEQYWNLQFSIVAGTSAESFIFLMVIVEPSVLRNLQFLNLHDEDVGDSTLMPLKFMKVMPDISKSDFT